MRDSNVNTTSDRNTTEILIPELTGIWHQLNSATTQLDASTFFLLLGVEYMAEFIPEKSKADFDKLWHLSGELRKSAGDFQAVTDQLAEICRSAKGSAK